MYFPKLIVTMYDNLDNSVITVNNGRDSLITAMGPIYEPLLAFNFASREDLKNRDGDDFR